jgi:hypothetical protein
MEAGTWLDIKGPALEELLKHGAPRCVTAWSARREKEEALATD